MAFALGNAIIELGGGRRMLGDELDLSVGLVDVAPVGTKLDAQTPLAMIHAATVESAERAAAMTSFHVTSSPGSRSKTMRSGRSGRPRFAHRGCILPRKERIAVAAEHGGRIQRVVVQPQGVQLVRNHSVIVDPVVTGSDGTPWGGAMVVDNIYQSTGYLDVDGCYDLSSGSLKVIS